jgi:threonine dehydratase
MAQISRNDIEAAASRINGYLRRTPTLDLGRSVTDRFDLVLKLEHLQVTGSFKPRGAFSLLTAAEVPPAGVVAASGGNFGIAVGYASLRLGHRATIFVPETSPPAKIDRIRAHGADVRVVPGFYDDARVVAESFRDDTGALLAHAFDDPEVVAGQGTLARELEDQTKADIVVVAVGGGGLIGGVASWYRDEAGVVAVEPETCRSFHAALEVGGPTEVEVSGVAVSSLGARVIGEHAWDARRWIDASVLVSDEAIVEAQEWLWTEARVAVEPAAATTVAALRTHAYEPPENTRVVAVLSGANVDPGSVRGSSERPPVG